MEKIPTAGTRRRSQAHSTSQPDLECLVTESKRLIQSSLSHNSKLAYSTAHKKYNFFLDLYNLPDILPIPTDTLLKYIAYLSIQKYSAKTVELYVRALSFNHKLKAQHDTTKSFLVSKAIEGLKRSKGKTVDTRGPITRPLLRQLISSLPTVCSSQYEATLFTAAFSLAYFGLLRVGEFTTTNKSPSTHCLKLHNVTVHSHQSNLRLTIPHSKTDQTGKSSTLIISRESEKALCPIQAILNYSNIRPHSAPTAPFFIHADSKPLTRYQFNSVLQKALSTISHQGHFSTHSFRIGRATDMAAQGVPDQIIKTSGRWRSQVFSSYVRL